MAVVATPIPRGAMVQWPPVPDQDLQGYEVSYSLAGAEPQMATTGPIQTTTFFHTMPSGTAAGTPVSYQVRSVDFMGNRSAWSVASTVIPIDGVYFDELMAGNINASGTITGGALKTATGPTGAYVQMDSTGINMHDGTNTDHGAGAGVTMQLNTATGNAFFAGNIQASTISGSTITAGTITGATGKNTAGTTLWDGTGLISSQVISTLGSGANGVSLIGLSAIGTTTNVPFTLSRTNSVLILGTCWSDDLTGPYPASVGVTLQIVSGASTIEFALSVPAVNVIPAVTCFLPVANLAAGSYNANFSIRGVAGHSISTAWYDIVILQLGS